MAAKRRVLVLGAGPAGLMAAGQAAAMGASVTLLEKMDQPGRKLRITGKGRCNLTNVAPLDEFISHFGRNGRFLRSAFASFFTTDLIDLLEGEGVATVTERGGRVFPASERAKDVVDALVNWAQRQTVILRTDQVVSKLLVQEGRVTGVELNNREQIQGDAVILATGGASYPGTGSTGDGYRMAQEVGHSIVPIRPALVPLVTTGDLASRLQGLSLRNVNVQIWVGGKRRAAAFGEMLFTHFGVSGPIILSLSGMAVDALRQGESVLLSIDLKPALDEAKLDARLLRELDSHGKQQYRTLLKKLLPSKLIPVCMDLTRIPPDRSGHQITSAERKRLRRFLKDLRLEVNGHRPLREAIITAGGVSISEVDPRTMASRLVDELYFAGEILDLDADTGGYNLQAAFSTGWLAGQAAAGTKQ